MLLIGSSIFSPAHSVLVNNKNGYRKSIATTKEEKMKKIGLNDLVRRQTGDSKYSHFRGTWKELVELVESHFDEARQGYRDGVLLIPLPSGNFFSGVVELSESTPLYAKFAARRKDEEPYLQVTAAGEKSPAKAVEVIIYRHDVLGDDATAEAEWEIVSLNARSTVEPESMTPITMARNFLGLVGGTWAEYTAQEFAESILFWSKRAMRG